MHSAWLQGLRAEGQGWQRHPQVSNPPYCHPGIVAGLGDLDTQAG